MKRSPAHESLPSIRWLVRDVLFRVFKGRGHAEEILDRALKRTSFSKEDRALASEIVFGSLRWWRYLDWVLSRFYRGPWDRTSLSLRCLLVSALYQILFLDRVPAYAVVDEAVRIARSEGGRAQAGLVNALLRTLLRGSIPDPLEVIDDPVRAIAVRYAHPDWVIRRWLEVFGRDRTLRLCQANNERPPMSLRVNRLKNTPDQVTRALKQAGFSVNPSPILEEILLVDKLGGLLETPLFRQGQITIQDGSAALVSRLMDPKPGEVILDVAAAPGGKTFHLAERSDDKAFIVASDLKIHRLARLRETRERLGIRNVHLVVADGRHLPFRRADKILVDAPCSGFGVIRRHPEIRWRVTEAQIPIFARLQRELLEEAGRVLKPGGVLVYSTCTVFDEENQGVIREFCRDHPEFKREEAEAFVPSALVTSGCVETWPDRHGLDGSFAARLRKSESNHDI